MAEDPRIYMRVYRDLAAQISDGRLPSGTILNMGRLADEYGVARETIQRALRRLAQDGTVTRYPGIGWQVE